MTQEYRGRHGTSEGGQIRHDVVDRGNESLVHDVRNRDHDTTGEGHGQKKAHHGRSLADARAGSTRPTVVCAYVPEASGRERQDASPGPRSSRSSWIGPLAS